jgi:hypothetical protein
MTDVARSAVLLADGALRGALSEFARRDRDSDDVVSLGELWAALTEFTSDARSVEACHAHCARVGAEHAEAENGGAAEGDGCTALAYAAMRGAFDASCQEAEVHELDSAFNGLAGEADELLRRGDPAALGLAVDAHGVIIDPPQSAAALARAQSNGAAG